MRTNYFFPRSCKLPGIIVALLTGILLLFYYWGADFFGKVPVDPVSALSTFMGWNVDILVAVLLAILSITLLMAAFSKEKDEDEYTAKLRGDSLIYATVINYILLAVASLLLYGFFFMKFVTISLYMIVLLHFIIFNIKLYISRKTARYEEQG